MSLFVLLNILLVSNHAPATNYKQISLHLCVSSKHTHTKKKNPYKTTTEKPSITNSIFPELDYKVSKADKQQIS